MRQIAKQDASKQRGDRTCPAISSARLAWAAAALAGAASSAMAGNITSGNSTFGVISTVFGSTNGDSVFTTGSGQPDQLFKYCWYYRAPNNGQNRIFSSLDTPTETLLSDTMLLTYTNAGPGVSGTERINATFTIKVTDTDGSGSASSARVEAAVLVQSAPNNAAPITYRFFNLFDSDVGSGGADDSYAITSTSAVTGRATDAGATTHAYFGGGATSYQVGSGTTLRSNLASGGNNLTNSTTFAGDGAIAFGWNPTLSPGQSVSLVSAMGVTETALPASTYDWTALASSTWQTGTNWNTGLVADSPNVRARFAGGLLPTRPGEGTSLNVVTIDGSVVVESIEFADPLSSYDIAGGTTPRLIFAGNRTPQFLVGTAGLSSISTPITLNRSGQIDVGGSAQVSVNATLTGAPGARIEKTGAGTARLSTTVVDGVSASAGVLQFQPAAAGSRFKSLDIAGGTVDVTTHKIVVDYTGASPLSALGAKVASNNLLTTAAAPGETVAVVEATGLPVPPTSFGGQSVDATSVLITKALKGDSDISGTVGFNDLLRLAQNYETGPGKTWTTADSDYNGLVDFQDLLALAQNYTGGNAQAGSGGLFAGGAAFSAGFAADWALAQSMVPEPAALTLLVAAGLVARRRR